MIIGLLMCMDVTCVILAAQIMVTMQFFVEEKLYNFIRLKCLSNILDSGLL